MVDAPIEAGGVDDQAASALQSALRTIASETEALTHLARSFAGDLGDAFSKCIERIAASRGRVVVSGMGKSGLVGRKIAATLSSTGTPALFLHPGDASHGDLGMVTEDDVALVLSWSGETSELDDLIAYSRRFGVTIIALTSRASSSLARHADVLLIAPSVTEACPIGLAPTSSTTVQMVIGDAIAVALLERRGFTKNDFHQFHPKGRLGARLLTVRAIMSTGIAVPRVRPNASIGDAVMEMTAKRFGVTAVTDDQGMLVGAFTDGDLRRSLATGHSGMRVSEYMSNQPLRVEASMLASEALALMNNQEISQLFVCEHKQLIGIVHVHDILRAGVV